MIRAEELPLSAEHPAYAGHFPGHPILPGVVLLDAALRAAATAGVIDPPRWQVATAKFHLAVRPGQSLTLERETMPNGAVRFAIRHAGQLVASGTFRPLEESGGGHG